MSRLLDDPNVASVHVVATAKYPSNNKSLEVIEMEYELFVTPKVGAPYQQTISASKEFGFIAYP
ncbi:MAG TPA: hypothetical protein VMM76_02240 [Pirellulaceae bacterium]|nr:hypothetical protein [Pirellulaceae bacterium]